MLTGLLISSFTTYPESFVIALLLAFVHQYSIFGTPIGTSKVTESFFVFIIMLAGQYVGKRLFLRKQINPNEVEITPTQPVNNVLPEVKTHKAPREVSRARLVITSIILFIILSPVFLFIAPHILPPVLNRPFLHMLMAFRMGGHDTYLKLSRIGNERSVPYMITVLKEHQSENYIDPEIRSMMLSGLNRITNNNFDNPRDWENWWGLYKDKSKEEWLLSGIEYRGYRVSGYPNNEALLNIMKSLCYKEPLRNNDYYFLTNGQSLLKKIPSERIINTVVNELAIETVSSNDRIAYARALGTTSKKEAIPILTSLVSSKNKDVRDTALFELNSLKSSINASAGDSNLLIKLKASKDIDEMTFVPNYLALIYATRSSVSSIDIQSGKTIWVFSIGDRIVSRLLAEQGVVVFCTHDGNITCLDSITGKVKWQYDTQVPLGNISMLISNNVVSIGSGTLIWSLDLISGKLTHEKISLNSIVVTMIPATIGVYALTYDQSSGNDYYGSIFEILPNGKVAREVKINGRPYELIKQGKNFYITMLPGRNKNIQLIVLNDKLKETSKISMPDVDRDQIFANDDILLARCNFSLNALDRKNGDPLWSKRIGYDRIILKDKFIAINDELLDPLTGVLIHKYNVSRVRKSCINKNNYALADYEGNINIFKILIPHDQ